MKKAINKYVYIPLTIIILLLGLTACSSQVDDNSKSVPLETGDVAPVHTTAEVSSDSTPPEESTESITKDKSQEDPPKPDEQYIESLLTYDEDQAVGLEQAITNNHSTGLEYKDESIKVLKERGYQFHMNGYGNFVPFKRLKEDINPLEIVIKKPNSQNKTFVAELITPMIYNGESFNEIMLYTDIDLYDYIPKHYFTFTRDLGIYIPYEYKDDLSMTLTVDYNSFIAYSATNQTTCGMDLLSVNSVTGNDQGANISSDPYSELFYTQVIALLSQDTTYDIEAKLNNQSTTGSDLLDEAIDFLIGKGFSITKEVSIYTANKYESNVVILNGSYIHDSWAGNDILRLETPIDFLDNPLTSLLLDAEYSILDLIPRKYFSFYHEGRTCFSEDYIDTGVPMIIEIDASKIRPVEHMAEILYEADILSIRSIDGNTDIKNRSNEIYPESYYESAITILTEGSSIEAFSTMEKEGLSYAEIFTQVLKIFEENGITFEDDDYFNY